MKFVEVQPSDMKRSRKPKGEILMMLEEFLDSEVNSVEVALQPNEYKNMHSAATSIACVIKKNLLPIKLSETQGHLYLFRKRDRLK